MSTTNNGLPVYADDIKWGLVRQDVKGNCAKDEYWNRTVRLFRSGDCNLKSGQPKPHSITSSTNIPNMSTLDMGKNNLNNVLVPPGYLVNVYDDEDYKKLLVKLGPGFHYLKNYSADNKASSLKVFKRFNTVRLRDACCAGTASDQWKPFCGIDYDPSSPYTKCPSPSQETSTNTKEPSTSTAPASDAPEPNTGVDHTQQEDSRDIIDTSQDASDPIEPEATDSDDASKKEPTVTTAPASEMTQDELDALLNGESDSNTGIYVGVGVGTFILILLIGLIIFFIKRKE